MTTNPTTPHVIEPPTGLDDVAPATNVSAPVAGAPSPLLEQADHVALVDLVARKVQTELNLADFTDAEDVTIAALELIAVELDRPAPYPSLATVPARLVVAATIVACDLFRRPGFAFGAIGVNENGGTITAGRDPLGSVRGLLAGCKARFGVA